MDPSLTLLAFADDLAGHFSMINTEWIEAMYALEAHDRDVLGNPRARIIDRGGEILFVHIEGLGIVGACALMPSVNGAFELTKMGVLAKARGRKAGEFLLAGAIAKAHDLAATGCLSELYLLTNKKSEAAIHLYEKLGFIHSEDIMARFGRSYERCNVAMAYPPLR